MIEVERDDDLTLRSLLDFVDRQEARLTWTIFALEYSGEFWGGLFPMEIEESSKSGIELSSEEFSDFEKSVHQVIEAEVVGMDAETRGIQVPHRSEEGAVIKVVIYDGAFWEIGGSKGEQFIAYASLKPRA